jgi:phage tail-like protein
VRRDDWMLAQLPMGMLDDDFFVRFVSIFQNVATSLLDDVDNLGNIVDVTVAPDPVVRWMGGWLGITSIDASLPHELQRHIVRASGEMLAWRGTRRGLQAFLELMSGGPVEIEESGGIFAEGEGGRRPPFVRMTVQSTGWVPEADFVALVADEVPAGVAHELYVGERRVWPPARTEQAVAPMAGSS